MRNSILRPLGIAAITATLALGACGGQNTGDAGSSSADSTSDKQAKAESTLPQGRLEAPGDARVYFIGLEDGDTVSSPVTLRFGLEGAGVAPAGTHKEGTGHHHLLVDVEDFATDRPLPSDEQHIHFGGGQTQTELELEPGEHTLQLVLGDWKHQPHDPVVSSERITIMVE